MFCELTLKHDCLPVGWNQGWKMASKTLPS